MTKSLEIRNEPVPDRKRDESLFHPAGLTSLTEC
jgi:hypothetical protein